MGYKKITPNLDDLAKNGILFKKAIVNASHTKFSIPSFFTSTLPPVNEKYATITEILKDYGYKTGAFNPNPVGIRYVKKDFDTFDHIFDYKLRTRFLLSVGFKNMVGPILFKFLKNTNIGIKLFSNLFSYRFFYIIPTAKEINEKALEWIKKQKEPFFLWIHYLDVHAPYAPPDYKDYKELQYLLLKFDFNPEKITNEETQGLIKLYDENIKYVDTEIGRFIQNLKKIDVYKNSLIIITADHGEAFNEHGVLSHITGTVYDELLNVPLIIHGHKKGIVIKKQVQLLDLAPTICELTNTTKLPSFEGNSLFKPKDIVVISNTDYATSYRTNNYKLIINKTEPKDALGKKIKKLPSSKELYNLIRDPKEKNNIYDKEKEVAKKLYDKGINEIKRNLMNKMKQKKLKDKIKKVKEGF